MSTYQELIFYQKAPQIVKALDALVKSWPKSMQVQEVSHQLFRSATSVGANIAEGSANETEPWLYTAKDCEIESNGKIDEILKINNEVIRMITSTISTIRAKQAT